MHWDLGIQMHLDKYKINKDLLLVLVVAGMVSPIVDTDVGRLVFELVRGHF